MVYVTPDGRVLQNKPWGFSRLTDIFWGAIEFVSLFFRSLVGLDRPAVTSGSRSGPPGGPGSGPPRPPRRMGGITTIQDCSMPGGGG